MNGNALMVISASNQMNYAMARPIATTILMKQPRHALGFVVRAMLSGVAMEHVWTVIVNVMG